MESHSQKRKRICRLCWMKCQNFEVVGENTKDNMNILLLKMNEVASEETVICKNCAELVKKCFAFKSMCLDRRDYIISFVNDSKDTKLNLKDVFLCQKENHIFIRDDEDLCGLCMGLVKNHQAISMDMEGDNVLHKLMLEKCLPELDLTIIRKPIICTVCRGSLEDYYQFLMRCLTLEERVKEFCTIRNIANIDTDLINVLQCTLSDILTSKNGNTSDIVNDGKSLLRRESADELVEIKNENFMKMEDYQEFENVLFTPKDVLSCEEEDTKGVIIKREGEFYADQANGAAQAYDNFIEMENQEYLICDDIEIKTEQQAFERFHVDVAEPCGEILTDSLCGRQILGKHNLIKEDSSMYQCASCSFQTKRKQYLRKHMLVHRDSSEVTMHQCDSCSYQTKRKENLKTHVLLHKDSSEVTMYKCNLCSFQTKRKEVLMSHSLIHKESSEVTMYQCGSCSFQTKRKNSLKVHMLIHRDSLELIMYHCGSCSYQTKYKPDLKKHSLIHSEYTYQCASCLYRSKRKDCLKRHILSHRDSSRVTMYQCNFCSYRTKYKHYLKKHTLIHEDSPEGSIYQCDSCSYQTMSKNVLKRHSSTHLRSSEKTVYSCDFCSFQTKHKRSLKNHMLRHKDSSDATMYQCNLCPYQAKKKDCLRSHLLIHRHSSEVIMYHCNSCPYQTRYKQALKRHNRLVHLQ